jgi:hypothetical protein
MGSFSSVYVCYKLIKPLLFMVFPRRNLHGPLGGHSSHFRKHCPKPSDYIVYTRCAIDNGQYPTWWLYYKSQSLTCFLVGSHFWFWQRAGWHSHKAHGRCPGPSLGDSQCCQRLKPKVQYSTESESYITFMLIYGEASACYAGLDCMTHRN